MIYSMTAFSSAYLDSNLGRLTVEIRSVNSRFLDLQLNLPDRLRYIETDLRKLITPNLIRGKIEIKVIHTYDNCTKLINLDNDYLIQIAEELRKVRNIVPDLAPINLTDLCNWSNQFSVKHNEYQLLGASCIEIIEKVLVNLKKTRAREGQRLSLVMYNYSMDAERIIQGLCNNLSPLLDEYRERLKKKIQELLETIRPKNLACETQINIPEALWEEINTFVLRIDIAEELSRLKSHLKELKSLLKTPRESSQGYKKIGSKSIGKHLEFLCQEMNREVNTIGAKANNVMVKHSSIDLKLLIEQIREQSQNIE